MDIENVKLFGNSLIIGFFACCFLIMGAVYIETHISVEQDVSEEIVTESVYRTTHYEKSTENIKVCEKPEEPQFTAEEIDYLCRCVEAEAGNQSDLGKRLVCDVILNRYDNGSYSSIKAVIDEKNQFEVVSNGSINKVKVAENTIKLVEEELENRTNSEVLYFRTQHYHTFGTPLFQEDDHYFSK